MNLKATKSGCWLTHFRILITFGAVGLLCPFLPTARGDTTNTTESIYSPATNRSVSETSDPGITAKPETLLPATKIVPPELDANALLNASANSIPENLTVSTDVLTADLTGFAMSGVLSNSSPLPTLEGTIPAFGPSGLVLEKPGGERLNEPLPWAEVSLGWGQMLMQFFAPRSYPAPPGGRSQPDGDESDRPWPVIAAGAATGNSWNEPGTYQVQGFLLFCW